MAAKFRVIAKAEGTDPDCQVMLAAARFINQKWDWAKNEPRRKERLFT